jgi:hypothetical protein
VSREYILEEVVFVRAKLVSLIVVVVGASVIAAMPSRSEDQAAPRAHAEASVKTMSSKSTADLSQLANQTPDGAELIELYKTARTVADVETANRKVKKEVERAQLVASELARLHAARRMRCEDVEQSLLDPTVKRSRALSAALARIDGELTKSLGTMRQRVAADRSTSTRAKDDVNRYTVAVHELGRLNLQTQELAKAIQGVARSIQTAAASCNPTPIPPLFAEASRPANKVAARTRSRPKPRKRPAKAAVRRAPLLFRYYKAHRGLPRLY